MMTRTRYAPSPTGFMHIGNLRSALFSYLIAKHDQGEFILRIEDNDQERYELGAEEFIYEVLERFSLNYDEGPKKNGDYGPYIQSERLPIYQKYAQKLVDEGYAYYCFCQEETLSNERMKAAAEKRTYLYPGTCLNLSKEEIAQKLANQEKYVIRAKMPKEGTTSYHDLVYGDITVANDQLEDQILIKSDGYPTYNFANVVDDALMNITHVVRGSEYLSSTPKYICLYKALRLDVPEFVHLPLILKPNGEKLSKRNKDENVMDLLNNGFLPEAIINYIALLGWSSKSEQEFFTLEELVAKFDISGITTSPAYYDIKKLKWFNHHYMMNMTDADYLTFVRPFLEEAYDLRKKRADWVDYLILAYKKHLSFGKEIVFEAHIFFEEQLSLEPDCISFLKSDASIPNTLKVFKEEIEAISNWTIENIDKALTTVAEKTNQQGKLLYMPIRVAISGTMHGIDLEKVIYLMGQEKIIERLK